MNKKAFTLIELLAVIVVLAIIALIAVPAVLNIIEDSRKGAVEASARNIAKTAELYYATETLKGNPVESTIDLSTDTLTYDGDRPEKGLATFNDSGEVSLKMYLNGYCVTVDNNNKVESEKKDTEECTIETTEEETTPVTYEDGTAFYFDPTTGEACAEADAVSTAGTKDNCMKWYAFLTDETSETVNLILDHNTTALVAWNADGGETPDTVNAQLESDITNWNETVKASARLISATEVNQIAPRTDGTSWNVNDYSTYYYFHTGTTTSYTGDAGTNIYAWLFDNMYECTTYGCNVAQSSYGYWTSDLAGSGSGYAWNVRSAGGLGDNSVQYADRYGLRPVITVSKSVFE